MDRGAQIAIFDAVMFLIIMLVAAVLIFTFTLQAFGLGDVVNAEADFRYSQESFDAAMEASVPEAEYVDSAGATVAKRDRSVEDLLLDELRLLDDGVPPSSFVGDRRYNNVLLREVSAVVDTARYHFALFASYDGDGGSHRIALSDQGMTQPSQVPSERFAADLTASMLSVGKPGDATIEFFVWRVR